MNRRNKLGTALVVIAAVLFIAPTLVPVQPVLVHDTGSISNEPPEQLAADGVEIIAYENLSERGQEVYRQALENGGEYRVDQGHGAPEFDYPTAAERITARENNPRSQPGAVAIERPEASDLPPADERYFGPRGGERENVNESHHRQQVMRYDVMSTATEDPPLGSMPQLLRLGAVLVAIVSLGVGGYLLSSK